jgi:hypothetical protein
LVSSSVVRVCSSASCFSAWAALSSSSEAVAHLERGLLEVRAPCLIAGGPLLVGPAERVVGFGDRSLGDALSLGPFGEAGQDGRRAGAGITFGGGDTAGEA